MVEIDYYSKYLKYKQKYLKQKNLQVGGENIKLTILVKKINLTPTSDSDFTSIQFDNIEIDDSKSLKEILDFFLKEKQITMESYAVDKLQKEGTDGTTRTITKNLDLTRSCKYNNIKNNCVIIISEKKKIKINVHVKKIDEHYSPSGYSKTMIEGLLFNNTDLLPMIFHRLIEIGELKGPFIGFKFEDFEIKIGDKSLNLKESFLRNGINDNDTIIIKEKPKSQ